MGTFDIPLVGLYHCCSAAQRSRALLITLLILASITRALVCRATNPFPWPRLLDEVSTAWCAALGGAARPRWFVHSGGWLTQAAISYVGVHNAWSLPKRGKSHLLVPARQARCAD